MKVRLRDEALSDLAEIRGWYAQRNPAVARAMVARVQARLSQLAAFPEIAPPEPERQERPLFVGGTPLVIVYRLVTDADLIDVISIVDCRRDPASRFRP